MLKEVYEWIEALLFSVVIILLLFIFVFRTVGVWGPSMEPTLYTDEQIFVSHLFYTPAYGDVVVTTQPNAENKPLVKRVIALSGQTVNMDVSGNIYVDDVRLDEPYIAEPNLVMGNISYPVKVPEGHVFVMGDNRNHSSDSRFHEIGMIDQRYILGRVIVRFAPFNKFTIFQRIKS